MEQKHKEHLKYLPKSTSKKQDWIQAFGPLKNNFLKAFPSMEQENPILRPKRELKAEIGHARAAILKSELLKNLGASRNFISIHGTALAPNGTVQIAEEIQQQKGFITKYTIPKESPPKRKEPIIGSKAHWKVIPSVKLLSYPITITSDDESQT
jgi:hypothetical protein